VPLGRRHNTYITLVWGSVHLSRPGVRRRRSSCSRGCSEHWIITVESRHAERLKWARRSPVVLRVGHSHRGELRWWNGTGDAERASPREGQSQSPVEPETSGSPIKIQSQDQVIVDHSRSSLSPCWYLRAECIVFVLGSRGPSSSASVNDVASAIIHKEGSLSPCVGTLVAVSP
jgi:hypothetical protein